MGPKAKKLISICGPPLCGRSPQVPEELLRAAGRAGKELIELLNEKNGFYCFESALHVLPSDCSSTVMNIEQWNSDELWRNEYGDVANGYLFFAEDVFGGQFALRDGKVWRFDPESGETEKLAENLEEWSAKILDDYEYETGYPIAHEWQKHNGPLESGKRLMPKTLFVLGGDYKVENLYSANAVEVMRFKADVWKQIKNLPEGSEVRLRVK